MREFITMTEAAKRAGVSLVTLRKIVRERGIVLYRNPRDAREKLVDAVDVDVAMKPTPIESSEAQSKKVAA
ncbi:MAG TPA: hypothetical protein VMM78_03035 [Thermomicrobiales bacterium]|nr:hypothetical protein [Thermomicrobiales bacterium]